MLCEYFSTQTFSQEGQTETQALIPNVKQCYPGLEPALQRTSSSISRAMCSPIARCPSTSGPFLLFENSKAVADFDTKAVSKIDQNWWILTRMRSVKSISSVVRFLLSSCSKIAILSRGVHVGGRQQMCKLICYVQKSWLAMSNGKRSLALHRQM